MAYVRAKVINGCGPYYYRVKSVRQGKKVRQIYLAYLGRSYIKDAPEGVPVTVLEPEPVKPSEAARGQFGRLSVEGAGEAKQKKTWDRHRYEVNRKIAREAQVTMIEADALAKQAWRSDIDPSKFDWSVVQGKDIDIEGKMAIVQRKYGMRSKDYEEQQIRYYEEQIADERAREREDPEEYRRQQEERRKKVEEYRAPVVEDWERQGLESMGYY